MKGYTIMKTTSSDYIKEIKAEIKTINASMKRIEEAEKVQCEARNCRDYDKAQNEAKDDRPYESSRRSRKTCISNGMRKWAV